MIPFWVPNIVRHLLFRVAKKGTLHSRTILGTQTGIIILTTTHIYIYIHMYIDHSIHIYKYSYDYNYI